MKLTIKGIAKLANVSTSTVSRVLNNKSDINKETKRKIEKIITDNNYIPNTIARALVNQKLYTIGLIIPDISNPFFSELAIGVEQEAKKFGYSVLYYNTGNDIKLEKEAVEIMMSKGVDGIIASFSNNSRDIILKLENLKFPLIQVDRNIKNSKYPVIRINNENSAYFATKYLIENGHKKLAHFTGDLKTQTGIKRLKGFEKACFDMKILKKNIQILKGTFTIESGSQLIEKLFKSKNLPTAIFVSNDQQALGALYKIKELKLNVPDDISIMGHDDIGFLDYIYPRLTTMHQPKRTIGKKAVEILIKNFNNKTYLTNEHLVLSTYLVERDSVKKIVR